MFIKSLLVLATVVTATPSIVAHHSFAAEYDNKQPITLTGVIAEISWKNPHSYIYLEAKDASGQVVKWAAEGFPPAALRRQGVSRDKLKVGETITINGWKAHNNVNRLAGSQLTLADGSKLTFGPTP